MIRILCIGDIVSGAGCDYVRKNLWRFRNAARADLVIANGENSAAGNGISAESADTLFAGGVDVITTGNHVFRQKGTGALLEDNPRILRPANFPDLCPGTGYTVFEAGGCRVLVISLLGTIFMEPVLNSPFECADRILARERGRFDASIVDFHAEATSEKGALAYYLDGRVSALFGTHTHVQTSDARILPKGTGFITDAGMTGAVDSILGVRAEAVVKKFLEKTPQRFSPAEGAIELCGVLFDIENGKTVRAEAVKH